MQVNWQEQILWKIEKPQTQGFSFHICALASHNVSQGWKRDLCSNFTKLPTQLQQQNSPDQVFITLDWGFEEHKARHFALRILVLQSFLHLPRVFSVFFDHIEPSFTKLSAFNFCLLFFFSFFWLFLHEQTKVMISQFFF